MVFSETEKRRDYSTDQKSFCTLPYLTELSTTCASYTHKTTAQM